MRYLTDVTDRGLPGLLKKAPVVGELGASGVQMLTRWSDDIHWFAQHMQQRMRGNLYMELRTRRGYSRKAAVRAVRNATYDWKHGVTKAEVASIAKIIPFWRFWRLALKQGSRRLMEPLMVPNKALIDSFTGRSAISRIRSQLNIRDRLYDGVIDPEIRGEMQDYEKVLDTMERHLRPDWMRNRALTGHHRSPDAAFWEESRGKPYQYEARVLPPWTITDVGELMASWMLGVGGALASTYDGAGDDRPLPPTGSIGGYGESVQAGDWERWAIEPSLNMLFPRQKEAMQSLLQGMGLDVGGYKKGEFVNVNPAEYHLMRKYDSWFATNTTRRALGDDPDTLAMEYDEPEGRYQMDRMTHLILTTAIPWVGVEAAGFLNRTYYNNPYMPRAGEVQAALNRGGAGAALDMLSGSDKNARSLGAGALRGLGNYMGMQWYPYESSQTFNLGDQWTLDDRGQIIRHRAGASLKEDVSAMKAAAKQDPLQDPDPFLDFDE